MGIERPLDRREDVVSPLGSFDPMGSRASANTGVNLRILHLI